MVRGGPNVHLVLLPSLVVRGDLVPSDEQPQCFGRVGNLHSQVGGLRAVQLNRQLRFPHLHRGVHVDHSRLTLRHVCNCRCVLFQPLQVRTIDRELNLRVLASAASERGNRLHERAQICGYHLRKDFLPHVVHHLELVPLPRLHGGHSRVHRRQVLCPCGVPRHRRERELHFGELPDARGHTVGQNLRGFERRPFRCAQAHLELRLVVVRQEVLVRENEERNAAQENRGGNPGHNRAVRQRPPEQSGITGVQRPEEAGILRVRSRDRVPIGIRPPWRHLDPARRQHRRQREAHEHRYEDCEGHGEPEARHEPADDPPHEANRDEDGHEGERRGEHGQADFTGRLDGSLGGGHPLLLHEAVDVLQHDNRVVDHDSHGECQRKHRHRVQGEALIPDEAERGDDRCGDGDGGNEGRAPVPEEHQHDKRRQDRSDDQVLFHRADGRADELRHVPHHANVVTGRNRRSDVSETFLDRIDDLRGVRSRLPPDVHEHGRLAVDTGAGVGLRHPVLDPGDVAQENRMPFRLTDDDLPESFDGLDTPACAERQRCAPLLDPPARNLGILRLQGT